MTAQKITTEMVMRWESCYTLGSGEQDEARIRSYLGDGKTPGECLDLDIPIPDRFWLVLRDDVLDNRTLRLFACDCAEHVQPPNVDPRSWDAIRVSRLYARGQSTKKELAEAAEAAAEAWAAWTESLQWQLEKLREYVK